MSEALSSTLEEFLTTQYLNPAIMDEAAQRIFTNRERWSRSGGPNDWRLAILAAQQTHASILLWTGNQAILGQFPFWSPQHQVGGPGDVVKADLIGMLEGSLIGLIEGTLFGPVAPLVIFSQSLASGIEASLIKGATQMLRMACGPCGGSGQPPGHVSHTHEYLAASYSDFNDGVGIADPADRNSRCTALLAGVRGTQSVSQTWQMDQNMGTNLNGPGVGISNLSPPLSPAGGPEGSWLPTSSGIDLGIACPFPGSGPGNLWLVWSGMNWRSAEADSGTYINLCTAQTFASSSPGCLAIRDASLRLWATACAPGSDSFWANYIDDEGKYMDGLPFDTLTFKNDALACTAAHSHNYTDTVQDFSAGGASQTFDIIKNEAVVHAGSVATQSSRTRSATYMTVCWQVTYLNFSDPLNPTTNLAQTHDWKLIWDLGSLSPGGVVTAVIEHYGGQQVRDAPHAGGASVAMRGFYSDSADSIFNAGQNGFGSCTAGPLPEAKTPAPLV
jgi:hypothetical protein